MGYFDYPARAARVSFPLGGIGAGCVGLSSAGRLIDWEIMNRPNKGGLNGFTHFAVRAERGGELLDARILHGPYPGPAEGERSGADFSYGFGAPREQLAGLPHFKEAAMDGRFPVAGLRFEDPAFPGDISALAFNPFIPMNEDDSSLPAAFFEWRIENNTGAAVDYRLVGNIANPGPGRHNAACFTDGGLKGACIAAAGDPEKPEARGEVVLATDADAVEMQRHWFRGSWFDALEIYWRDLAAPGPLKDRKYSGPRAEHKLSGLHPDHSLVAAKLSLAPGESRAVRFIIAWHFPLFRKYWEASCKLEEKGAEPQSDRWKNYYAVKWPDARAVADYGIKHWPRLRDETLRFRDALFASTLPEPVLDAVSANLSALKSPAMLRLEDGTLYGFEGCHQRSGCCEGSCSHVWNYQQALPFLFPRLQRGMTDADFACSQLSDSGGMSFRLQLPLGIGVGDNRPCADGQFGNVMQVYRDWKISGDDEWLQRLWPRVKKAIEYAWHDGNPDRWDPEKTGVLWGRQHHTLDMELFNPNAWLTGYYLGALLAGAKMADYLGDADAAAEYRAIYERGRAWADEKLFNGEYFQQLINLSDKDLLQPFLDTPESNVMEGDVYDLYWNEEHGQIKYQIAAGCGIDQVAAQWHADLYGLGEIFERGKVRSALNAVFKHNFAPELGKVANPCRVFGFEDEAGTMVCTWPAAAEKPAIPLTYAQETMHGMEYAFGAALFQAGEAEKGIAVFRAVRDRYRGGRRNPWNEMECGSNYARSMASYSGLLALSGFGYDTGAGRIAFRPHGAMARRAGGFTTFWSVGRAWGLAVYAKGWFRLQVLYGELSLERINIGMQVAEKKLRYSSNIESAAVEAATGDIVFPRLSLGPGESAEFRSKDIALRGRATC